MLSEEKPLVMKRQYPKSPQIGELLVWTLLLLLVTSSCHAPHSKEQSIENNQKVTFEDQVSIDHAIGFDVIYHPGWKELHLFRHYNDFVDTVKYALTSGQLIEGFDQAHNITIPIKGIGALSTTQLGMFEILDALDHLKAIEVKRYVHSQEIIQRVEQGSIEELAVSGKLNLETTLASGIDLLMGVGYPNSQNDDFQTLQQAGLPVLLNADWQEKTLLGRAEWMKLLAILLNKEKKANEVWSAIEEEYSQVIDQINISVNESPTTITGLANGDSWYVAGGDSFVNYVLQEIKVNYPWSDSEVTGSLRLDFETVYEQGLKANYWLAPGSAQSLEDIYQSDSRYADFDAYKSGRVFNIFGRYTPGGGNDYYESAIVAPHIVLKDMVKIFHPEVLPDHELVYYNRLQ